MEKHKTHFEPHFVSLYLYLFTAILKIMPGNQFFGTELLQGNVYFMSSRTTKPGPCLRMDLPVAPRWLQLLEGARRRNLCSSSLCPCWGRPAALLPSSPLPGTGIWLLLAAVGKAEGSLGCPRPLQARVGDGKDQPESCLEFSQNALQMFETFSFSSYL